MKRITQFLLQAPLLIALFLLPVYAVQAQEETEPTKDTRPVKNMFESIWLIDNQTVLVPMQGTWEWDFQHRFGNINTGYEQMYGVFAPSNIRMGLNYVPVDNLMLGFGFTKERMMWDFSAKYALLKQGRSGGSPVSVTYLGTAGVDTRQKDNTSYKDFADRWSYFNQLMVARKLTNFLSLQVAGNFSYFNYSDHQYDAEGAYIGRMNNKHFGMSALLRVKATSVLSVIGSYDYPLTSHDVYNPEPSLGLGLEMVTSSHQFQVFVSNYKSIVPQINNVKNGNTDFLIGFNITRLWN